MGHRRDAFEPALGGEPCLDLLGPDRKGQRREPGRIDDLDVPLGDRIDRCAEPAKLELLLEHLPTRLREQHVARVVFRQHVEDQRGRGLRLPIGPPSARHEPRHAGDLAEMPPRHLRAVQAGQQILEQVGRREHLPPFPFVGEQRLAAGQFEAPVGGGHRERARLLLCDPPGDESCQSFMHEPAREGKQERMVAVARLHPLDEQALAAGQTAPPRLRVEERQHGLHLRQQSTRCRTRCLRAARRLHEVEHRRREQRGEWHPPAVPPWHLQGRRPTRPLHPGGQAVELEERERPAGE